MVLTGAKRTALSAGESTRLDREVELERQTFPHACLYVDVQVSEDAPSRGGFWVDFLSALRSLGGLALFFFFSSLPCVFVASLISLSLVFLSPSVSLRTASGMVLAASETRVASCLLSQRLAPNFLSRCPVRATHIA